MKRFTLLLLLACGPSSSVVDPPGAPVLPEGAYYVTSHVNTSQGDCGWVQKLVGGYVDVDSHGAVISPLPDFVKCSTHYAPFSVTCSGLGISGTLTGTLWNDSGIWSGAGSGAASENAGTCNRVTFDWWLIRYDRDGGK